MSQKRLLDCGFSQASSQRAPKKPAVRPTPRARSVAAVPLFLNNRNLREEYPHTTELLNMSLLPATSQCHLRASLLAQLKLVKTRLRSQMEDATLQELLTLANVADYTDVNGVAEADMEAYIQSFIAVRDRRLQFCLYNDYKGVRDWVLNWRNSFCA
ncbi:hypothetical protein DIPPA_28992 [Diplonema papillatum]|nr:hypothetical protein DIPPA_28992 [Diplonema papillatum]